MYPCVSCRSMELLQLRRDRVGRADSVIDKNQALVLSAPNLLPRLMELLRIMNYNPPLAMFGESNGGVVNFLVCFSRVKIYTEISRCGFCWVTI